MGTPIGTYNTLHFFIIILLIFPQNRLVNGLHQMKSAKQSISILNSRCRPMLDSTTNQISCDLARGIALASWQAKVKPGNQAEYRMRDAQKKVVRANETQSLFNAARCVWQSLVVAAFGSMAGAIRRRTAPSMIQ
ncbi:MAG: hypothetical protein MZU97_17860 [Bacillus subtilis]|nr:hypothetical protein [Bacillus subtilis]